jgi:hypothetical protein
MAQKVVVEIVDDLDGSVSEDVTTIDFALDGRSYEIDLNASNAQKLRTCLAEFVTAGRRARPRPSAALKATSIQDAAIRDRVHAILEWAIQTGHEVSDRGCIPKAVVEACKQALHEPSTVAPPAAEAVPATHTSPETSPNKKTPSKTKSDPREPSFSG